MIEYSLPMWDVKVAEKILMFDEYTHKADGIGDLHPYLVTTGSRAGKWYMTNWSYEVTLNEIGALCNIPKDEFLVMKLKYGAGLPVAQ